MQTLSKAVERDLIWHMRRMGLCDILKNHNEVRRIQWKLQSLRNVLQAKYTIERTYGSYNTQLNQKHNFAKLYGYAHSVDVKMNHS